MPQETEKREICKNGICYEITALPLIRNNHGRPMASDMPKEIEDGEIGKNELKFRVRWVLL